MLLVTITVITIMMKMAINNKENVNINNDTNTFKKTSADIIYIFPANIPHLERTILITSTGIASSTLQEAILNQNYKSFESLAYAGERSQNTLSKIENMCFFFPSFL